MFLVFLGTYATVAVRKMYRDNSAIQRTMQIDLLLVQTFLIFLLRMRFIFIRTRHKTTPIEINSISPSVPIVAAATMRLLLDLWE